MKYTKIKSFRTTDIQYQTLDKMKSYKIDVSKFIREAIRDKLNKEYQDLIPQQQNKEFSDEALTLLKALSGLQINLNKKIKYDGIKTTRTIS